MNKRENEAQARTNDLIRLRFVEKHDSLIVLLAYPFARWPSTFRTVGRTGSFCLREPRCSV